jgi:hypothetical protein
MISVFVLPADSASLGVKEGAECAIDDALSDT